MLRIAHSGKRKYITLPVKIKSSNWNTKTSKVSKKEPTTAGLTSFSLILWPGLRVQWGSMSGESLTISIQSKRLSLRLLMAPVAPLFIPL